MMHLSFHTYLDATPCLPPCPLCVDAVYHVTEDGWTKMRGEDVGKLHYAYYPQPEQLATNSTDPLAI